MCTCTRTHVHAMEAEKGNFYVSAVRSCASAAKRPPQRSEESTARSFTAELTSTAKRGVYSPYACLQCGVSPRSSLHSEARSLQCWISPRTLTSLRSSPPQRSEKSAVYVLSMEFRFTAELHGGAYLRSETRIYSVDFHS